MILHVNFSDGSNPWVCFSDDRSEICEHWKEWMKYHPTTAEPKAYCGNFICERSNDRSGFVVYKMGEYHATAKFYKYLGNALKAAEQRGGDTA